MIAVLAMAAAESAAPRVVHRVEKIGHEAE